MSEYLPPMRIFHPRAPRFSQEEKGRPQLLPSVEVSSLRSRLHPNGTIGTKSFKPITKQLSTTQPWATDLAKLFKAARKNRIEAILGRLQALGHANEVEEGRYSAGTRYCHNEIFASTS